MHDNKNSKGNSAIRCFKFKKYPDSQLDRLYLRSKYTPGGENMNCGEFGISPKLVRSNYTWARQPVEWELAQ